MRVKAADFERLNLRCHTLLSDVPLHDVWAIPLDGGGPGRSIQDARAILFGDRRPSNNFAVRGLFALRWALGRAFGWDDERHDPPDASYVNATVHAFVALALTPSPGGYTLYLAIYVKPVTRFTTLYMALIDPFRRLIVYPALGRQAQQRWSRTYA
jgi:hypothetical protein